MDFCDTWVVGCEFELVIAWLLLIMVEAGLQSGSRKGKREAFISNKMWLESCAGFRCSHGNRDLCLKGDQRLSD